MGNKVPPKISSRLRGFLTILTKPQRKHFLVYLVGLVWMLKFRSIQEIACTYGKNKTDSLHHFLKGSPKKTQAMQQENQRQVAQWARGKKALFILDDTPSARNGKKIEGIGVHHSAKGLIKGLCAVTAIVKVGHQRLVWAIRGYRPKKTCLAGKFKSKVQLALEILTEAEGAFSQPLTVLMDAWYTCAPILNKIQQTGWTFLGAIRRNRILRVDGRKTSVRHLAKGRRNYKTIRLSKKKRFRVAKRIVEIPKVGWVLLFISKSSHETRFFITNDLEMSESEMVRLYGQRFGIETFHKEIKQHLGFGEMFMRSWDGVQKHWTLVAIAYNTITLWNGNRHRSFRQMIRHFRNFLAVESMFRLPKQLKMAA